MRCYKFLVISTSGLLMLGMMYAPFPVAAQVGTFAREDLIEYTREWTGERFPDGRPRVPDVILERMKIVPVTLAWSVLAGEGYESQYDGSEWKSIHPGAVIIGRALTVRYMPLRPHVDKVNGERAAQAGRTEGLYSWGVDMLRR